MEEKKLEKLIKKGEKMKKDLKKKLNQPKKPIPEEEDPTEEAKPIPTSSSKKQPVIEEGLDCNKLLNIKHSHISYELAQRLKNECGITIGGRLSNYIPLLNVAQDIGRQIATIAKQGVNLAQISQEKATNN